MVITLDLGFWVPILNGVDSVFNFFARCFIDIFFDQLNFRIRFRNLILSDYKNVKDQRL